MLTLYRFCFSHLNEKGRGAWDCKRLPHGLQTCISRAPAINGCRDFSYPESGLAPTDGASLSERLRSEHPQRLVSALMQVLMAQRTPIRLAKGHPYECHTD